MIFNTWVYAAFVLLTFLIYWFVMPTKWRSTWLLLASYAFFTYHFPLHTLLILVMTLIVYWLSLPIFRYKPLHDAREKLPWTRHPKFYLTVIIIFCVGVLAYYKYLKMAISTINELLHLVDIEKVYDIPSLIVPLGLSFFVFEFIHYAVDVYQGKAAKTNLFRFAVFIMYFPSLVSGPIKRYEPFLEQTLEMGRFKKEYLYDGLARILIGLGKKTLIADRMTPYADYLLNPAAHTTGELWIGMYAYSLKILFDFSGYSDIAIGSAKLFGYTLPENFNWPYLQRNIAVFWNNWHMSLSSWIRDYVYIPLGGSRGTVHFAARNSLIAMLVSGLWHGAAWHFVIWGLYHGLGVAWIRYLTFWKKGRQKQKGEPLPEKNVALPWWGKLPKVSGHAFSVLLTYHFVAFGWILFYCDFATALEVVKKMIGGLL
ncbi:MAG: MBOAT family O-acyltransferase [Tumebacillaceae bacterium]